MNVTGDAVNIRLDAAAETDAFGLDVEINGTMATGTILAEGPGLFRVFDRPDIAKFLVRAGWIVGFVQRGPLRLPVTVPWDGWLLATAADGARVEHGSPLIRMLRKTEDISA